MHAMQIGIACVWNFALSFVPLHTVHAWASRTHHVIGDSLLTPAEVATLYKIEPKTYALAEGLFTLEEAVKL